MKQNLLLITTLVVFGAAYVQGIPGRLHPDARQDGPRMSAELDNEAVQVVRIRIAPRGKVPMHPVTPRVVVWLTDARLRLTFEDGTTREERGTAGHVEWVPAQRHAAENLDDREVEFLAVIPRNISRSQ